MRCTVPGLAWLRCSGRYRGRSLSQGAAGHLLFAPAQPAHGGPAGYRSPEGERDGLVAVQTEPLLPQRGRVGAERRLRHRPDLFGAFTEEWREVAASPGLDGACRGHEL